MKKKPVISEPVDIETVSLVKTARQRYLNYALSVITSRALPDVRDGLKPVQRRILYGMHEMHLSHEAKFQKSAQIVGQVMGRYHPHGDSAIYEALVRLAQPFVMRYPMVDGQGNFGSLDNDPAAAMRYTESRLQPTAAAMLEDLDEHIVEFQPNYSGTFREPTVLPAAIPTLLVNGSMGIAVGMATNIPPHNLGECIDGCIAMIDNPEMSLDALMKHIPAPDFPTHGRILTSPADLRKIYETGRGGIDIQGEFHLENEGKKEKIVVTSIPYTVNKADLVKTIGDLIESNKLPLLLDVRDESAKDVRIVMDLKNGADPNAVMAYLYKHTPLQSRFNVNFTCIIPGEHQAGDKFIPQLVYQPKRIGLCEYIRYFIGFRREIVTKRLSWQLHQLLSRIHILEGFAKLFSGLDEAIRIIRNADDKTDAASKLCARFDLDATQADAILELKLYRLAKLEADKILSELQAKQKDADHIQALLKSPQKIWKLVRDELLVAKKTYADPRRTQLKGDDLSENYDPEQYIIEEDCFVIVTKSGLFKRQKSITDVASIRTKENDAVTFVRRGSTRAALVLTSSLGKAYTMLVDNVPATTGHGSPIATVFKLADGETIIGAYIEPPRPAASDDASDARCLTAITRQAQTARIPLSAFTTPSTASGRIYMRLNEGDSVLHAAITTDTGFVSCIATNTRAIVFDLHDVPLLKTAGKGARALALDPNTTLAAARCVQSDDDGVRVKLSDMRELTISVRRVTCAARGSKGRLLVRHGTVSQILDTPYPDQFDRPDE